MPTVHVVPFPPDTPWQEFEAITRDGMALKWGSPDLQLEGRPGQDQHGVDIFGPDYLGRPVAIQCKKYKEALGLSTVTEEVGKAEGFTAGCNLNCLYIATTAPRDAKLQCEVRKFSAERVAQGKFAVGLLYWDDIFTGLLLDHNTLCSHFPYLKFGDSTSPTGKGTRIAGLALGYYGRFLWNYLELIFGEFGWLAGQDPEEARTVLRIVRENSTVAPQDVAEEIVDWCDRLEDEIFSPKEKVEWESVKMLAKRVSDRVKFLSITGSNADEADFIELGISIGALGWREGEFSQNAAEEVSTKICSVLPSASLTLPHVLARLEGKDCYNVGPVLYSIAERELRWPTTE